MKPALIFYLTIPTSSGVCWRWRSINGAAESTASFMHYCDCVEDARSNGYAVQASQQPPGASPMDLHSSEQREQYQLFLDAEPGPTIH